MHNAQLAAHGELVRMVIVHYALCIVHYKLNYFIIFIPLLM